MKKLLRLKVLSSVCLLGLGASPAFAQTAPVVQDEPAFSDDIIVTAAKRGQRLIDVPNAVTAISSDVLNDAHVQGLQDVVSLTPGLIVSGSNQGRSGVIIRGVATALNAPNSPVGTIVDGVPIGSSSSFTVPGSAIDINPADLQRIEILRGPQGTLYGANSLSGLISYVTKDPALDTLTGEATVGVSQVAHGGTGFHANVGLSGPVVADKVGVRVSGFYNLLPGFIDNPTTGQKDINSARQYGGRAALLARPSDDLTIKLAILGQKLNRRSQDDVTYSSATFRPTNGNLDYARANLSPYSQRFIQASGTIDYATPIGTLTSLTAYANTRTDLRYDYTAAGLGAAAIAFAPTQVKSAGLYYFSRIHKFTEEVRLTSPDTGPFKYIVGAFYTRESTFFHQEIDPLTASGAVYPAFTVIMYDFPTTYREYAGFANASYNITEALEIGGGIRYSHNDQTFAETATGTIAAAQGLLVSAPQTKSSEGVVTYAATAKYNFTRNFNIYFRASSGYAPGGPNFVVPGISATFSSQKTNNYEVGAKSSFLDNRVSLNVALYQIDFSDIQLNNQTPNGITYYTNGSKAVSKGVEFEGTLRPLKGLTLTGNVTYNDAYLTEDAPSLPARAGQPLPGTPSWAAGWSADYRAPISERATFHLGTSGQYVGERLPFFTGQTARIQFPMAGYTLANARIGVDFQRFDVSILVRNIGDERGQLSVLENYGRTIPLVTITPPRSFELNVHYKF